MSAGKGPKIELANRVDYNHLGRATFWQRLTAGLLDILLLMSLYKFAMALLIFAGFPVVKSSGKIVWVVLYFVYIRLSFSLWSASAGKRIVGLRVVSNSESDLTISSNRLMLRETFGKLISVVSIVGLFVPLLAAQGLGLHDHLSKTRVVSLREEQDNPLRKITLAFVGICFMAFLTALAATYRLLYTPFPIQEYFKELRAEGWKFEEVKGNLKSGFHIGKIAKNHPDIDLEFTDISLRFGWEWSRLLQYEEFSIPEFSIGGGVVDIKSGNISSIRGKYNSAKKEIIEEPQKGDAADTATKGSRRKVNLGVLIENCDMQNIVVKYAKLKITEKIQRIVLNQIHLTEKEVAIERLYLSSDSLAIDLAEMSLDKHEFKQKRPIYFTFKRHLFPQILAHDLNFQLTASGKRTGVWPEILKLRMGSEVYAEIVDKKLAVEFNQFKPMAWFKLPLEISQISAQFSYDLSKEAEPRLSLKGDIQIARQFNFEIESISDLTKLRERGFRARHMKGTEVFYLTAGARNPSLSFFSMQNSQSTNLDMVLADLKAVPAPLPIFTEAVVSTTLPLNPPRAPAAVPERVILSTGARLPKKSGTKK